MRDIILLVACVIIEQLLTTTFTTALCPERRYGRGCRLQCNCADKNNCKRNGNSTSYCQSCAAGFALPNSCQRQNVALHKRVRCQSETVAEFVIVDAQSDTCSSMGLWFEVDLGRQYLIKSVYFSQHPTFQEPVSITFVITVPKMNKTDANYKSFSQICFTSAAKMHERGQCNKSTTGRYLYGLTSSPTIQLCELSVYVCPDYTYGKDCESVCACENPYEICDRNTGDCPSGCYVSNPTSIKCQAASRNTTLKTDLVDQTTVTNPRQSRKDLLVSALSLPAYAIAILCIVVGLIAGTIGICIGFKCAQKRLKSQVINDNYLVPEENGNYFATSQTPQAPSLNNHKTLTSVSDQVPYYDQVYTGDMTSNPPYYNELNGIATPIKYEDAYVSKDDSGYIVMVPSYDDINVMPQPPCDPANNKTYYNIGRTV